MLTSVTQRWRAHRASYRPAGEPIATHAYEVAAIADDGTARAFVEAHHYSSTYPAARYRFGLYRGGQLVGVAVFSHPARNEVLTNVFPGEALVSVELGRLVLLDDVPSNGETWFLGRAFELLRAEQLEGVVSFSDPVPRTSLVGERVFKGHVGTIYQAFNGVFLGRAKARTLALLPDGSVFSERAQSKIRARDRGWRYAAGQLEAVGAVALTERDDARVWLKHWMGRLTRPLRHPGNFRYAWGLDRSRRRSLLPQAQPYPKMEIR